jgi:flagellar hook-basal body complex protein FliE
MPTISSLLQQIPQIPLSGTTSSAAGSTGGGAAFSSILQQSVQNVSQFQSQAEESVNQFVSGENDDPHTMMLAVQRSSLAFDMFVQVRNKVVQAYQEVMKMPE